MIARLRVAFLLFFAAWIGFGITGHVSARQAALIVSIIAWIAWGIAEHIQKRKVPRS